MGCFYLFLQGKVGENDAKLSENEPFISLTEKGIPV